MSDVLKGLIRQFMPFAKEKMGFSRPPRLFLRNDPQNAANPLGKTGFYDVEKESITLYTTDRHPKDILRSLAHELQHHTQKCNGEFDNIQNMGEEGYAQNNPQMRAIEYSAYMASMCVRDFEDGLKLQKETIYYEHLQKGDKSSMSTKKWKNQELKSLLSEAWGFKMDLSKLNESKQELKEYSAPPPKPPAPPKPEEEEEEEEPLEEMCPGSEEPPGEMMVTLGDEESPGMGMEGDVESLAAEAMEAIHKLASAAGADISSTGMTGEEAMEDEPVAERRGRGRRGPHIRGADDPRLREMIRKTLKEMTKGK